MVQLPLIYQLMSFFTSITSKSTKYSK